MDFDIHKLSISLARPTLELPDPDTVLWWRQLEQRELWLDDSVDWESVSFIAQYVQYLNNNESEDMTPIKLHILSGGGDLYAMFALYNILINSKIPIHTINEGIACSAAFILFLAGSKRTMNKYGYFVAHEGSAQLGGTTRETKAAMKQYEIDVDNMARIIADRTKISKEEVNAKYDAVSDWFIRYDEALETGIITE